MTSSAPAPRISGIVPLTHLGVIRAQGEEAVKFLQGQLTQDVALMGLTEARLAAFCNAKGRMQASFVLSKRSQDDILMVCSRDILAATLKRLSMFVMRAKVKLSDASDQFTLHGVVADAIESIAGEALVPWAKADFGAASMVALSAGAGHARALWCAPAEAPVPQAPAIDLPTWHWLEVRSGIAMVTQPVFEAFMPQMLNYESVGGVNFKKGCYPGQEVVARSQYRGTLKRRAHIVHAHEAPAIGQEVFHASDAAQPCGLVAAAGPNPAGGFDAIVSMQTSAAADAAAHGEEPRLFLGSASGAPLALLPLPYPLLSDI